MQESDGADLDQIRAILAVMDAGSMAAAARLIGRDPAIVTRRLKALERRLGVRLFDRSTRRLAATRAGKAYREQTAPLVAALDKADRDARDAANGTPRGHLRVAMPGSFGPMWLRPIVVRFLAAYPDVTVQCDMANDFVDLIGERYDLAIRLAVLRDSRLVARRVGNRRRLLCASPALLDRLSPIKVPADLARVPCLSAVQPGKPHRWSLTGEGGDEVTVTVAGPLMTDDAGLLVEAAVAGLGVLRITDWYVGDELAEGRLVPVLPEWQVAGDGGIYLVTPAIAGSSSAVRAFADWIRREFQRPPWAAASVATRKSSPRRA